MGKTLDFFHQFPQIKRHPTIAVRCLRTFIQNFYACLEKKESNLIFRFTLPLDYQLNFVTHSKRVFSISSFTSSAG